MKRAAVGQEVSCAVAVSPLLYPSLLHRKSSAGIGGGGHGGSAPSGHAASRDVLVPGTLLEVRRLWQPPPSTGAAATAATDDADTAPPRSSTSVATSRTESGSSPPRNDCATPRSAGPSAEVDPGALLYAFVRVKDADHRLSGWLRVCDVYVKNTVAQSTFGHDTATAAGKMSEDGDSDKVTAQPAQTVPHGFAEDMVRLSCVLSRPWLSGVYAEVTPGMARTQRARRQLDYLEERLLRDCRTPTTVRYFVYLNTYVFAPWYYAPFGLLNSEYDPMLPSSAGESRPPQPYIRDGFLCPFSLRLYSSYEQMHYETRTYRAGRLRPPGEEIYRDDVRGLSLFKINGSQHVTYCRHLFLVGKSFLENKLAGHDVHSYHFFVLCLHHRYFPDYVSDTSAMYFAGFFSWEKHVSEYNLACIATLPCFAQRTNRQRSAAPPVPRHLGQFMISVSYELAYRRKQIGTPEKPLSDLGAVAYQHWWRRAIVRWMKTTLSAMRWSAAVDVDGVVDAEGVGGDGAQRGVAAGRGAPPGLDGAANPVEVLLVVTEDGGQSATTGGRGKTVPGARKRTRDAAEEEGEEEEDGETAVVVGEGGSRPPHSSSVGPLPPAPASAAAAAAKRRTAAAQQHPTGTSSSSCSSSAVAAGTGSVVSAQCITIKEIAAAARLEEADVLKTLLGMGVLHRGSEGREILLLLPQRYVDWMYDEMLRWESSPEHAVFQPVLLKSRTTGPAAP
ncbi:histone acetyltransferase [Novymonas esmeraldas]|uniref:histone acetyltransferase n=1 Tax=Novymonas esmeraldas TaxID=1808958 RepID=A0AAW0EYN0_9TRYP